MNAALGLSETAYGLGAGIFFVGYCLLEVPSNMALYRFGARRWIARIMITWGVLSAAGAFVAPISAATGLPVRWVFYLQRLLLGCAEAGFFPGVAYYLTLWFPAAYRSRVVGLFYLGSMSASIVGQPLSGALLNLDVGGLQGWQWMFIAEACPAVALSAVMLLFLTDRPSAASWLSPAGRDWLARRLDDERRAQEEGRRPSLLSVLADPRLLACAFVFFLGLAVVYGLSFFLPSIVRAFGAGNVETGLLAALPTAFGAAGMLALTRRADRTQRRREHLCFALLLAALGTAEAAMVSSPVVELGCLCLAYAGVQSVVSLLVPIPSGFLSGGGVAAGLAAVTSVGNLGGLAGPALMGWLRDSTGDYRAGLIVLAATAMVGSLLALGLKFERKPSATAEGVLSTAAS